jgi:predicted site-specific integrase-resolvase
MENPMNLTTKETANRLRVRVTTLANWRVRGDGPRFIKMGRKVLYPMAEIEAFEQRQLRASTAGAG